MKNSLLLKRNSKTHYSYADKFNIIMMGEEKVGKTDILKALSKNRFNNFKSIYLDNDYQKMPNLTLQKENLNQDNIIEKIALEYNSEEKNYLIKIWNYSYVSNIDLINDFMKKADAFIIVYSILDKNSFNNIEKWIMEAKNKTSSKNIKFFILGNNCEEINERQVGIDEVKQLGEKENYKVFEISTSNMKEFEDSFNEIFNDIIKTEYSESDYSELSTDDNNNGKKLCCCCRKKCIIF